MTSRDGHMTYHYRKVKITVILHHCIQPSRIFYKRQCGNPIKFFTSIVKSNNSFFSRKQNFYYVKSKRISSYSMPESPWFFFVAETKSFANIIKGRIEREGWRKRLSEVNESEQWGGWRSGRGYRNDVGVSYKGREANRDALAGKGNWLRKPEELGEPPNPPNV